MKPATVIKTALLSGILLSVVSFYTCLKSTDPGLPEDVLKVLNETGFNRIELTKTIAEFIDNPNSLKLTGAYFLISNMDRQYYVDFYVHDTIGNIFNIDPLSFASSGSFMYYWKKLDSLTGGLFFKARTFVLDTDTLESALLVSRINKVLDSSANPYLGSYPSDATFNFTLPYRIANEAVENWQQILIKAYPSIFDQAHTLSPDSMIRLIDRFVEHNFTSDARFVKQGSVQPLNQLIQNKTGSYEDLAQLRIKMLRTAGIPATMDYVPYLADSVNGFHWAVAMNSAGVFIPLVTSHAKYLFDEDNKRIPKIYRRVYAIQSNSLFRTKDIRFYTPPFLGHYDYVDVTHEYFEVSYQTIDVTQSSDTIIYVTVYNDGKWKAIDYAFNNNEKTVFQNIRSIITYKPAVFSQESIALLISNYN